ncbi:sulfite exporter TauE/SafE family protein [Aliagarivorans taiwanensis]|uniref:sulfite exporter TauE/SafE family protein n=1 Tax=Aliagarivorans taiwanensis TaxID=561966 RepID=UPI0004091C1E|nr:sulfite exporter TauE/SafE family protein [Aliagarivorans taiwanensis]
MTVLEISALLVLGLLAGGINTLAGGGSNLTVPALMVMGMPAEVANATNRVGIFLQCLTGTLGFKRHNQLDTQDLSGILWPMFVGGLAGSAAAAFAPSYLIKYLLLGAMLSVTGLMLLRSEVMSPEADEPVKRVNDTPSAWPALLFAGFYGGFVQAGVGFVLLAALVGSLRYDLIKANALKLVCTLGFTAVALVMFIWQGQVSWLPALVLAAGYMVGAQLAVKLAISAKPQTLKRFLFAMTLVACVAALFSD